MNELVNTETGEIEQVIKDTESYTIVKQVNGKYRKDMKYKKYYSLIPSNEEETIELYKILNTEDNDLVTPMKNIIGKEIEIHQVYTNPYQSFDEGTGGDTNGVTTTIYDGEGYIATSSKAVYYTVFNLFNVFGHPNDENFKPIKVKVTGTKMQNGTQINLELISV